MTGNYSDLATLLARGISQRRMYFEGHPNVIRCARDFVALMRALLQQENGEVFLLGVDEGKLFHDGRLLVGSTVVGRRLTEFVELMDAGGIEFDRHLEANELVRFFTVAADTVESPGGLAEARSLMGSHGIGCIHLSPPYRDYGTSDTGTENDRNLDQHSDLESLLAVYQAMFETVETAHARAALDRDLDINEARSVGESMVRASLSGGTDVMNLVHYPDCDAYTVGHSVRVAMLSILVGRQAGLSEDVLCELGAAGLLHDVGKGKIPQEVLFKPGKLDAEERAIIETHPEIGARMLLENREASPLSVAVAWGHHRRHDGGGYPDMPHGSVISQLTQMVHVCDVFEALTAIRPYKRAMTPRHAYEIMLSERSAFSPAALTALVRAVGMYPPGNQVTLDDGRTATVLAATMDPERPRVKVTHGADGKALTSPCEIDLAEDLEAPAISQLLIGA